MTGVFQFKMVLERLIERASSLDSGVNPATKGDAYRSRLKKKFILKKIKQNILSTVI